MLTLPPNSTQGKVKIDLKVSTESRQVWVDINKWIIFGGSVSAKWFFVYFIPCRIGIWKCWFLRRGENRSTRRKTSRSKGENQQQTQPTYGVDAGIWTRATLVGGESSHHCAILCSPSRLMKLLSYNQGRSSVPHKILLMNCRLFEKWIR